MGKENVLRWLNTIWIYEEVSIDVEEIHRPRRQGAGDHPLPRRPRGRAQSGLAVVPPGLRSGMGWISQAQSFLDRDDALEAAGLRE